MRTALIGLSAGLLVVTACASTSDDDARTTASTHTSTGPSTPTSTGPETTTATTADTEPAPTTTSATTPASAATTEPPVSPTTEPGGPTYDFGAINSIVQGFVDENELNGAGLVIVHRDDGVIHDEYWGEFSADRISLIASSSKMITAGVLMRLHDDGVLDIDAPIADVTAWGAGNPDVTPAQLVSNSSGLVGLLPLPTYAPYFCQYRATGTLQECAATIFETPDDDADVVEPDTEFRYGGAQWQVAGAVAEVATGKSWAQLVDEIYVQPCGLEALGYNNHFTQVGSGGFDYPTGFDADPGTLVDTDNPNMEGGAYVTTGDYAKLLLMHLRGGLCDDNRVLSADAVDRLHADRVADVYDGSPGYGMGWWVDRGSGRITDGGAYGSVPWLDLADGYGGYLVIEADSGTGGQLAGLLYDVVDDAVNAAN